MIWFFLILAVILFCVFVHSIKRLNYGNLTLISGGVKTGKTMLSVYLVLKTYRKQLLKWRLKCFFCRLRRRDIPEKPLIYSNMPLACEYSPLTLNLITGVTRFRFGSVVYYNEMSLIAGSKDIRDEDLNDFLLQFFKLCAHETHGGYFFIDTQSPQDMHYTLKRSLSTYYFIIRKVRLPFFNLIWLRENLLVDGENTVAIDTMQDPQDNLVEGGKKQYFRLIPHRIWKYYDQYAYSILTDFLPVDSFTLKPDRKHLKIIRLIRCRDLKGVLKNAKK